MTAEVKRLEGQAPTDNEHLIDWINEAVDLFEPEKVVFADGSDEEWNRPVSYTHLRAHETS